MFRSVQSRPGAEPGALVDIAPLIDVVFLLLLFFLVSSTFLQDTGVRVERARAAGATSQLAGLRVSITAAGNLYAEGEPLDLSELARRVAERRAREELRSVLLIPDKDAAAGRLVEVLDAVRRAGVDDVAIAAERTRS